MRGDCLDCGQEREAIMRSGTECPKCGHGQSYRAMVDGKPMRQCSACRHLWAVGTKHRKAEAVKTEPEPEQES